MSKKNKHGFTLIELLIVIAIVGILSAIGLLALNNSRERARDAKRESDLDHIRTAMQLYFDDHDDAFYDTGGAVAIRIDGGNDAGFTTAIQPYLPQIPDHPKDTGNPDNDYWYINEAGAQHFALATKLEGSQNEWYILNNYPFGGKVDKSSTGSGASQDYDNTTLQCSGGSSDASHLEICTTSPSGT